MSNRSATERIAVELLGWRRVPTPEDCNPNLIWLAKSNPDDPGEIGIGAKSGVVLDGCGPDFTTLDGCREFEKALSVKSEHELAYASHLMGITCALTMWQATLHALPEQRVAACLRWLDEVKR